jgi:hypothetical protein
MLLSVPHGGAAGNMLRTGMLRRVLDAVPEMRVTIVSPLARDPDFVREHGSDRVAIEELPPHKPAGLEARLLALIQAAYLDSGATASVRIRRAEAIANGTVRWIRAKRLLAGLVAPSLTHNATRYDLSDRYVSHPWAESLFSRLQPSLVVVSSPGLIFAEVPLLRTAVRRGVRTMAVDPSWDNFTNKVLPVRRVNRLIVWNELMQEQAVRLHGYRPDEIRLAGVPQFDLYFREGVRVSREAFVRGIGGDPDKKLVTLTTTPRELYPHYEYVIGVLIEALRAGRFGQPVQLLVRVHPRDDINRYTAFQNVPDVIVEKPFRTTVRAGDGMAVDVTHDAQRHLAATMKHSDVIVSVASTIAIEGAIFDTPGVNIAFDGPGQAHYVRSARRYLEFTHFTPLLRHQAMRNATTADEMIEEVRVYLSHPERDRDGRRRVVEEQCQVLDGRAAERVADCVVGEWHATTNASSEQYASCAALPASSR